jgi:hypothetical protein
VDDNYEDIDEPDSQLEIVRLVLNKIKASGSAAGRRAYHHLHKAPKCTKYVHLMVHWYKLRKLVCQQMAESALWTDRRDHNRQEPQRATQRQDSNRGGRRKKARTQDRDSPPGQPQQPARREARAQTKVNSSTACKGCGRTTHTDPLFCWFRDRDMSTTHRDPLFCWFRDRGMHPEANSTDLNWSSSPSGRACIAKGLPVLPSVPLRSSANHAAIPTDAIRAAEDRAAVDAARRINNVSLTIYCPSCRHMM